MPRAGERVRWGIIGRGWIAEFFATGLRALPDAELAAVGSRRQETAEEFADKLGVPKRHGSHQALANEPTIDIIYVSTPHSAHLETTLLCLEAGKPVLCEKPFAINTGQAETMIAAARQHGLFLMEGMWTRFTPLMTKVRDLIADGAIGEVRMLSADFGFRAAPGRPPRLFDPATGGGALLDVGVYVVSFSSMILGTPDRIVSLPTLGDGIDEQAAMVLGHPSGALAILSVAIRTETPTVATIMGTDGMIAIHRHWWKPTTFTLTRAGQEPEEFHIPPEGNGYNYEAAEAMRCLREGLLESPILPHEETLSVMRTLDAIRAQWGLRYPME
jgi:predicted dehydrogenase